MNRPNAEEFLQTLLDTLDDLPPDFARRLEEVLKTEDVDRSQAIRQLFEELACERAPRDAQVPAPRHGSGRPEPASKAAARGARGEGRSPT